MFTCLYLQQTSAYANSNLQNMYSWDSQINDTIKI